MVGELQVRGATVFSGYWRQSAETVAAFTTDGWFRTGDIAERAADGYFTLRGRRSDLIISGGFNIYPREVEEVLSDIRRSLRPPWSAYPTSGAASCLWPSSFSAAGQSIDIDSLEQQCRRHLASFKVPKRFEMVDRLPRNALGKVVKGEVVR